MPHRLAIVVAVLLTSLAPAGAALGASAGGGAELPARAYHYWCANGADCTYDVHDDGLDAGALGSGEVEWIGVDEPLDAAQRRAAGGPLEHVPVMLGAIAVSVNIPGVSGHHVDLTGRTLGQIFSGEITRWSDARIRRQNPNQPIGRGGPITLCVPAQRSSTTWDMTEYLAKVSPEFRERVGGPSERPASWRAPRVVRVADVAALGRCVLEHEGAITFWDYADALRSGEVEDVIAVGEVKTVSYPRKGASPVLRPELVYSHPSEHGMLAAGTAIERSLGGRLAFDATSATSVDAYPITTLSWVAFRADRGLSPGAKASLTHMLSPAGQARLQGLGYGRLSPATLAHARKTIAAAPRAAKAAGRAAARPATRLPAPPTPADIVQAAASSGLLTLGNVTITSTKSPITATATLTTVKNPVPMNVTVTWTDKSNWTITVQRNSAVQPYDPGLQTKLNVNNLSGTITNTGGALSFNLVLSGQVLGSGTFDMTATISKETGLEATANVANVILGGMTIETGTVTVSTASATASVVATLKTTAGTFHASLDVTGPTQAGRKLDEPSPEATVAARRGGANSAGPPPPPPPVYTIKIAVSGADLAGSNPKFQVTSFSFTVTITSSALSCNYIETTFAGSVVMENNTYTMKNGYLKMCGQTVDAFHFDVSIVHYVPWKNAYDKAELRIAWATRPYATAVATYTAPSGQVISYASGFFGSVSLSQTRDFTNRYGSPAETFSKTVTIGLAFGVAVYTPADGGPTAVILGAGGGVSADRISGGIGCTFQAAPGTDFSCIAALDINPPNIGSASYQWEGF